MMFVSYRGVSAANGAEGAAAVEGATAEGAVAEAVEEGEEQEGDGQEGEEADDDEMDAMSEGDVRMPRSSWQLPC